jgi:hypothetical protein
MSRFYEQIVRQVNHFGAQEWFWILAGVLVVGAFFLRGFGSRKQY